MGDVQAMRGTKGILTRPVVIQEAPSGEVLAQLRLELPDEGRRKEQCELPLYFFPGLEGTRGVSPALSDRQLDASHFCLCPSFHRLQREDFPRSKIPNLATVTFPCDLGWGHIWPKSPFLRLGGGAAEAVRAREAGLALGSVWSKTSKSGSRPRGDRSIRCGF